MIRIALPNKGSLSDEAVSLCKEAGYRCRRYGRELCVLDAEADVEFVFLRPRDIAVYVGRGVLDAGITGRDLNADADQPAVEALALGFGKSTFRYAVPKDSDLTPEALEGRRVACSYKNIVRRDLERRGIHAAVVPLDGAVEISVRLGVADAIADVVESGQTLREAGLKTVGEPVLKSEAIVIVSGDAALANPQVKRFLEHLRGIVVARQYSMVEYDIRREALAQAVVLAPGFEAPTVSPLNDPEWVAVKVMLPRGHIHDIMDSLADIGARGIVVTDIRTCRL
jgi:ATP phosphoribosyltransferase